VNILNDDMQDVISSLDISESDKNIMLDILYNERINKDKEWSVDARRYIKSKIDEIEIAES
jgi:hypothetical protein